MKSKRLLSALVAAAMIAGTMPVTVFAGRLDYEPEETEVTEVTEPEEKETSKPTVKETKPTEKETEPTEKETEPEVKETEKPAETQDETVPETEAPAETEKPEAEQPKETEAPAETEKPAEETPAEAPKESEKPAEVTHKAPAKNATISNAVIANGTLTWDSVDGAAGYDVTINEHTVGFDNSCGTSVDINKEINHGIKSGLISKPKNNTYTIKITAYTYNTEGVEVAIAESDELTYVYNTSASLVKVGTISGVKTSGKNLVWNSVKGATEYCVYYDGEHVVTTNSYPVGPVIDKEIEDRIIWKSVNDKYPVYILAYDSDGVLLAEFSGEFVYKTSAAPQKLPSLTNVKISADGILTWDDFAGATGYSARILGINKSDWAYRDDETINSIDLKKAISESIKNGYLDEVSSYKIELYANEWDYIAEFELSFKYKEVNTLSLKGKTAKVKKSKVKKHNVSLKAGKVIKIAKRGQGALTYAKASGNKKILIASNGKVTCQKKLKKGTYKVTARVTAAGNDKYAPITKSVTFKIKVK